MVPLFFEQGWIIVFRYAGGGMDLWLGAMNVLLVVCFREGGLSVESFSG